MKDFIKLIFVASIFSGCVYYRPAVISTTSLNGVYEKPVLVSSGEADAYYILGIIGPFGDDSLKAAVEKAKGGIKADSLVNVYVDRKVTVYPFTLLPIVIKNSTRVFGTLIRYEEQSGSRPKSMVETETAIEQERIRRIKALFAKCPVNYRVVMKLLDGNKIYGLFKKLEVETVELSDLSGGILQIFNVRDIKEASFSEY